MQHPDLPRLSTHLGSGIGAQAGLPPRLNQARLPHREEGEGSTAITSSPAASSAAALPLRMEPGRPEMLHTATYTNKECAGVGADGRGGGRVSSMGVMRVGLLSGTKLGISGVSAAGEQLRIDASVSPA